MSFCKDCFLQHVSADEICTKCEEETNQIRMAGEDMEYPLYYTKPFSRDDTVLIRSKETPIEFGWLDIWPYDMDKYIGKIGEVKSIKFNRLSASVYFEDMDPVWRPPLFPLWTIELQETAEERGKKNRKNR